MIRINWIKIKIKNIIKYISFKRFKLQLNIVIYKLTNILIIFKYNGKICYKMVILTLIIFLLLKRFINMFYY
jgi:hypothetical protein